MIDTIKIIKKIDAVIGPIALKLIPGPPNTKKSFPEHGSLLVIRPGGMGDAILLLPILKKVRQVYPKIKIDILCEQRNIGVFKAVSFLDGIFSYKNFIDLLKILSRRYDVVVDTEQYHILSTIVARLTRSGCICGFRVNGREKLHSVSVDYSHDTYEAVSFWNIVSHAMDIQEPFHWDFPYFDKNRCFNFKALQPNHYICLFPGATIYERTWPENRWVEVIDALSSYGWTCVMIGGKNETTQCETIIKNCKTRSALNFSGKLSIKQTIPLLKNAALLISTDSGILHLGVLCGTPTTSLFGSGIQAKWGPEGKNHAVINKNVECSPCTVYGTTPRCPHAKKCIMEIQSSDILDAVKKITEDKTTMVPRL